jgi:hypothetical protein
MVRARDGYVAPMRNFERTVPARTASRLPPSVAESLGSPLANPAVPMRVFAAPYKGPDRQANVVLAIEIDASTLDLVDRNGAFVSDVAVATVAIAAGGKVHPGRQHQVRLTLRPDTYERAKTAGVRVTSDLTLPPGRYQLRVAGGAATGRAGNVVLDLEVPDFTRDPLVMSGVSLTSTAAQAAVMMPVADPLQDLLPGPMTAAREFQRGETIALYTEVYENLRSSATHSVDFRVDLRTDDGRVLSTTAEERSSKELGGRSGGYGFVARVPLQDVEPGIYVIHIEARANIGDRPVVARDVQIRVR